MYKFMALMLLVGCDTSGIVQQAGAEAKKECIAAVEIELYALNCTKADGGSGMLFGWDCSQSTLVCKAK